jgi:transcriptional regulator NrdR family protein
VARGKRSLVSDIKQEKTVMGGKNGGTKMYCPACKIITTCRANSNRLSLGQSGQRFHIENHVDIEFLRRLRVCLKCEHEFLTVEVNEKLLGELVELRDALKKIKENAATFSKEITNSQKSLKNLSSSLGLLKTLK